MAHGPQAKCFILWLQSTWEISLHVSGNFWVFLCFWVRGNTKFKKLKQKKKRKITWSENN